jgi:hypothetical protein
MKLGGRGDPYIPRLLGNVGLLGQRYFFSSPVECEGWRIREASILAVAGISHVVVRLSLHDSLGKWLQSKKYTKLWGVGSL